MIDLIPDADHLSEFRTTERVRAMLIAEDVEPEVNEVSVLK